MKFLIAIGDVRTGAVVATNGLVRDRVREKRNQVVSSEPRKPDDDRRWLSRDLRPNPCFDAGTPKPKWLRQESKRQRKTLELAEARARRLDRNLTPDEEAALVQQRDRVQELTRQATAASKASG